MSTAKPVVYGGLLREGIAPYLTISENNEIEPRAIKELFESLIIYFGTKDGGSIPDEILGILNLDIPVPSVFPTMDLVSAGERPAGVMPLSEEEANDSLLMGNHFFAVEAHKGALKLWEIDAVTCSTTNQTNAASVLEMKRNMLSTFIGQCSPKVKERIAETDAGKESITLGTKCILKFVRVLRDFMTSPRGLGETDCDLKTLEKLKEEFNNFSALRHERLAVTLERFSAKVHQYLRVIELSNDSGLRRFLATTALSVGAGTAAWTADRKIAMPNKTEIIERFVYSLHADDYESFDGTLRNSRSVVNAVGGFIHKFKDTSDLDDRDRFIVKECSSLAEVVRSIKKRILRAEQNPTGADLVDAMEERLRLARAARGTYPIRARTPSPNRKLSPVEQRKRSPAPSDIGGGVKDVDDGRSNEDAGRVQTPYRRRAKNDQPCFACHQIGHKRHEGVCEAGRLWIAKNESATRKAADK